MSTYSLAIHGGAGTISRASLTPDLENSYSTALEAALSGAGKILAGGGSAMDAVISAVMSLEDCPLFNAGKGSVFTADATHEMDAAVMRGDSLEAGAVAGITGIKNPVLLARAVMEKSEHVMLSGKGAETFAREAGIHFEPPSYFYTEQRFRQLEAALREGKVILDHSSMPGDKKFGTVGAVARDMLGNLAAATSTGGMTNKRFNRIGDSPVIGAGTYANNITCAVSCTGHGEYFIRAVVAYDISCLMEYRGMSLQDACQKVIGEKLVALGGEGGAVAVDSTGHIALPFNSEGMYRGWLTETGKSYTAIYRD